MSILSGFKKFKSYLLSDGVYQLDSRWTSSQTVIMGDGADDTDTLESRLGGISGITSLLTSTDSTLSLSASAGKVLKDLLDDAISKLENITGITTSLDSTSDTVALAASAGKVLNDSLTTLIDRVGTITGITNSRTSTSTTLALSAYAGKLLQDSITSLQSTLSTTTSRLGNCTFSVRSDGAYVTYTPTGGADSVTKKLGKQDPLSVSGFSLYSTTRGSASVSGRSCSVSFSTTNGQAGEAIMCTTSYYSLEDYNYILLDRTAVTNDTTAQTGTIYLISSSGTITTLATRQVPTGFTSQHYVDISGYSGTYRIGFSVNTGAYIVGYSAATGTLTINSLILA